MNCAVWFALRTSRTLLVAEMAAPGRPTPAPPANPVAPASSTRAASPSSAANSCPDTPCANSRAMMTPSSCSDSVTPSMLAD